MRAHVVSRDEEQPKQQEASEGAKEGKNPAGYLSDMLEETRILLPGTQVFAGFLITLPFTNRFGNVTTGQRNLFLVTFMTTMLSLICFIMPAAYHRIARPIHDKQGFKVLATRIVVIGLVPFSISTALATYLIMDVVIGPRIATIATLIVAAALLLLWWLFPLLRLHDRIETPEEPH